MARKKVLPENVQRWYVARLGTERITVQPVDVAEATDNSVTVVGWDGKLRTVPRRATIDHYFPRLDDAALYAEAEAWRRIESTREALDGALVAASELRVSLSTVRAQA